MRKKLLLLLLAVCLPLGGCSAISDMTTSVVQTNQWYTVSGFIDGDTFKIKTGSEETTVRLLYIDTPETKKPGVAYEPFGPEASTFTEHLLTESKEVRLTFDKDQTDKYDRTLAVVELKDGRILNELLLEQGLAKVLIIEPNVKMENVYKQLEQKAKQQQLGIWEDASTASNSEFPVKKAARSGIIVEVNKQNELVTISNTTNEAIVMDGWKLVSVKGNQTYPFTKYELPPGEKVIVSSADQTAAERPGFLPWGATNIWNNSEPDPAELYNSYNELVAVWEDH